MCCFSGCVSQRGIVLPDGFRPGGGVLGLYFSRLSPCVSESALCELGLCCVSECAPSQLERSFIAHLRYQSSSAEMTDVLLIADVLVSANALTPILWCEPQAHTTIRLKPLHLLPLPHTQAIAREQVLSLLGLDPLLLSHESYTLCLRWLERRQVLPRSLISAGATTTVALCDASGFAGQSFAVSADGEPRTKATE